MTDDPPNGKRKPTIGDKKIATKKKPNPILSMQKQFKLKFCPGRMPMKERTLPRPGLYPERYVHLHMGLSSRPFRWTRVGKHRPQIRL